MPNAQRMEEVAETDQTGMWVNANMYGSELPEEAEAKFLLSRSAKGLWRIAIRGYNDGEQNASAVSSSQDLVVPVGLRYYTALNSNDSLIPVTIDEYERYVAGIKQPETHQNLLVQVLENQAQGIWSLLGPAEYNQYDSFGQLMYVDPEHVALSWGDYSGQDTGETSHSGYSGYSLTDPIAATIKQDGPNFLVSPHQKSKRGLARSAIRERTHNYPTQVSLTRELTAEDETMLQYLNDSFAFGGPTSTEAVAPPPSAIIYGNGL